MSYLPTTPDDRREMLAAAGASSFEELVAGIPGAVRLGRPLDLPAPLSEHELRSELQALSEQVADLDHHVSFLGGGAYDHF
ncbi:MAG: glycine dehydrogenase, partial [Nitrospirota bacterium]|nr:glycine dehydrogenase [Nitrospirota bacterium]